MMRALHILVFCNISYGLALDIFIDGRVLLLDCRTHVSEAPVKHTTKFDSTEEDAESTTKSHTTEEPVDPKELFDAARDGDLSFINAAIARLSSSGLNLNWHNTDHRGYTALHIATEKDQSSIVGALLDAGADPDVKAYGRLTPVYIAAAKGHTGPLKLLLAHGIDPNNVGNGEISPLQEASAKGNVEAARMLITAGAHVDFVDSSDGRTALHWAAMFNQPDFVLLLLQNGADKNKQDIYGDTPADLARRYGYDSVAQLINNYSA